MTKCWRINLRRRDLMRYVTDELTPDRVRRIEDNLLDCGDCRDTVARLRGGGRFAAQLPRVTPQRDAWKAIEAAIDREDARAAQPAQTTSSAARWRGRLLTPRFALAAIAGAMLL